MANRKMIDCRRFPSETGCTLALAGSEDEVLRAAVLHATTVHGHADTPDLRAQLKATLEDERTIVPQPGRKVADCRAHESESHCTLVISGREDEVLGAAVAHAVSAHGHAYSPSLKDAIRGMLQEESTPEAIAPSL
jgi:predicted small metal-binding protein